MTEQTDTSPDPVPASRITYDGPRGPLFKAMAEARKHFGSLSAEATADVHGVSKSGKAFDYKFSYAPLDVVLGAIDPGLQAAGIALLQPFDGDILYTIVACGESSLTVETPLPSWTTPQELGSLLTYLRRYQIKGIFGVADSEDDDGNQASGNKAEVSRKQPSAPKPSGPNVPKEVIDEVFAAGKEKGLGKQEFYARAKSVCGKDWLEFTEGDAKKLLADLVMK